MSMDHSHSELDRRIDSVKRSLGNDVSNLESRLSDAENTIEDMARLPSRVDSLEYDLREAQSETQQVRDDLEGSIGETDASLSRVATRVAALERHLRQAKGAIVVDLDDDDGGELHALAVAADKGRAAQAQLLSTQEHGRLARIGTQLTQALESQAEYRAATLRAAAVLATTPADDPRRTAARADFERYSPLASQVHSNVVKMTAEAEKAAAKLAANDAVRTRNTRVINAGERADTKLRLRLRSRLSDAVGGAHLLPVWFAAVFGPMPPARKANEWLDAATDVLAYRATYQITDPVTVLGPKTDGHVDPRRRAWSEALTRELRRWG